MYEFVVFLRDCVEDISFMLDDFEFVFEGMTVSIMEIFIGFIALGMIISIFWKGARS